MQMTKTFLAITFEYNENKLCTGTYRPSGNGANKIKQFERVVEKKNNSRGMDVALKDLLDFLTFASHIYFDNKADALSFCILFITEL